MGIPSSLLISGRPQVSSTQGAQQGAPQRRAARVASALEGVDGQLPTGPLPVAPTAMFFLGENGWKMGGQVLKLFVVLLKLLKNSEKSENYDLFVAGDLWE